MIEYIAQGDFPEMAGSGLIRSMDGGAVVESPQCSGPDEDGYLHTQSYSRGIKMRNSRTAIVIILAAAGVVISCYSPYIGRSVQMNLPAVCSVRSFPAECTSVDNNFTIGYSIDRTSADHGYRLETTAAYHGSLTWTYYSHAVFTLVLIKDGVIEETVSASKSRGGLAEDIHFERHFATPLNFDAALITYSMRVSDSGGAGPQGLDAVTGRISSPPIY